MSLGAGLMERRKPPPQPDPPPEERATVTVVNLKGSPKYAKFMDDLHDKTHIAKATLWRLAMKEYCQNHGHDLPPEI